MRIKKNFFEEDAEIVARELLGKTLIRRMRNKEFRFKIVETEAYLDEKDPGSRAKQKGDLRKTMMMPAGTLLVYGVHNNWMLNFVTGKEGKPEAVLIRAVEPLNFSGNTSGPGRLTKVLKINKKFHKKNIFNNEQLKLENSKQNKKFEIVPSFRIGIKEDLPKKMRFYIKGNEYISKK